MSRIKEGSDINVGSIEKDIKRCEKLTEPQNANWIGISNQLAIAHVVDRVKELEAKLEFKSWGDLDNIQFEEYMNQFMPKQKVKDKIDRHKIAKEGFEKEYDNKHYEDDEIRARDFYGIVTQDRIIQVLEELLENK